MFGHLKAEDFINAIEGMSLSPARLAHLDSCAACAERLRSIRAVHNAVAIEDTIPEPDWNNFRESVRVGLLSRSAKRASVVRRWTGWPVRPGIAWAVSFVLLICVSAGGFLWHLSKDETKQPPQPVVAVPSAPPAGDVSDMEAEVAAWGQSGLFEDLAAIEASQAEQIRKILIAAAREDQVKRQ